MIARFLEILSLKQNPPVLRTTPPLQKEDKFVSLCEGRSPNGQRDLFIFYTPYMILGIDP
ncbi:hypothetical protein KKG31_03680 [Patescibacteria group bacterium]|nr:hypothetical protein [Patescibacteria group bacterium]MBU1758246.1 hypothetical protein [Patescibacteria group bacterium]